MDKGSEIIDKFEALLKEQTSKKPLGLYSSSETQSKPMSDQISCTPRDILVNVYKQMKAIQNADVPSSKRFENKLDTYKMREFLTVDMIPVNNEVHRNKHSKFETQCVSDTQLIDIIENAEIIDKHRGVTQEFDSTFCLKSDENDSDHDEETPNCKMLDEQVCKTDDIVKKTIFDNLKVNADDTSEMDTLTCLQSDIILNNETSPGDKAENPQNEEIVNTKCDDITDRSPSPILNPLRTSPPLVYSLYAFEKFENLAHPIIEENTDLQTAKNLINSQIIDCELFLPNHMNNNNDRKRPVVRSVENISINADKKTIVENKEQNPTQTKEVMKTEIKDDILFSSDEEDEYLHKDVQELPLTCALETSFYEKSDILDKSMYVGFQTASNKSIQISTESFCKAKSIFDDTVNDGTSLQDLVELFDTDREISENLHANLSVKFDEDNLIKKENINSVESDISKNIAHMNNRDCSRIENLIGDTLKNESFTALERNEQNNDDNIMMSQIIEFKSIAAPKFNKSLSDIFEDSIINTKRKLEGFKTASNKKIKLSDKALTRCKKVFKDINLEEEFEDVNIETEFDNKEVNIKIEDEVPKLNVSQDIFEINDDICVKNANNEITKSKIEDVVQINDLEFLQEFESNDMPFEKTSFNIAASESRKAETKNLFQDVITPKQRTHSNNVNNDDEKIFKKPKVMDKAIMKPKMCQDINIQDPKNTDNLDSDMPSTSKFIGFKTAANKEIFISEKTLDKMKNFYADVEIDIHTNSIYETKDPVQKIVSKSEKPNIPVFKGFHTANNKPITISEKALEKSKKLLEDISRTDSLNNEENKIEVQYEEKHSNDVNKISKPEVPVKDKNSIVASIPCSTSDDLKDNKAENVTVNKKLAPRIKEPSNILKKTPIFKGFQTASNKQVTISNEAIAKSRKLFEDMNFSQTNTETTETVNNTEIPEKLLHECNKNNEHTNLFVGFKTASSKPVKISADALARSKRIFSDIELENATNEVNDKIDSSDPKPLAKKFIGFHTASNKEVKISEDALTKSKRILNDFEFINDNYSRKPEITKFVGFKTASNKDVVITDEALAKSKNIFKDINEEECVKINEVNNSPVFKGFQTASNKDVQISKKALEISKKLFQDIDINENIEATETGTNEDPKVFRGFQTASNKKVNISEKALAMSKKLFEGIELSQPQKGIHDDHDANSDKGIEKYNADCAEKCFTGFQTASNKKVVISEDALARTKDIFNEDFNEHNDNSAVKNSVVNLNKVTKLANTNTTKKEIPIDPNLDKTDLLNKDIIDTQVLNDFQESLNTEDFCKSTPKSKRSGSPILSCPRAKKRKFEAPYRNDKIIQHVNVFKPPKLANTYKFNEDYKKNKKYTLKDLKALEKDTLVEIDPYVTKFNIDNFLNFAFFGARNDYTDEKIDVNQLKNVFLDAVNKKNVPDGWLENHIKLILWKLLSYEIKFPSTMKNVCTFRNVMDQLKYRYDKELYNVERPILRLILEKDDVASNTMVLCVAGIYVDNISVKSVTTSANKIELLLTDGWYCVRASIDRMLSRLVCNNSIVIGTKIATSGAELINCEQGIAPWEDISSVRLKLSGNSTRRAHWLARLGRRAKVVTSALLATHGDGGRAAVRGCVVRVYPPLYVERAGDGNSVTLSERLEHIRQMKYESEQQILMEKLYEELEKELADQESQDSDSCTNDKTNSLDSGSQISKLMKKSRDPDEYRSHLTASQNVLLEEHNLRRREKQMEELRVKFQTKLENSGLKTERNVVQLLKVRLVDFNEKEGGVEIGKGYLSIWKPSAAVMEVVTEGAWIEILNVIPTGVRNSEIQLSAGRQTVFNPYKQTNEKYKLYSNTLKRKCYEIKELSQNPSMTTDYNEIDTVGIIFQIEPTTKEFDEKKQNFQNVFLADADKNMICVNFWGGLKKFGFENTLDTGQIITCVNLQKRAGNSRKSIPQYRVTEFTYFTKTPKDKNALELSNELSDKLSKIKEKFCEDCVLLKNNYSIFKTRNIENVSPYAFGTYNMPKRLESPMSCDANLNLTGLDFESSFHAQMSPEQLVRKKRVKEKIEKLKIYGEPPPLSSIHIINKSKNASATYKSPLISNVKVASEEKTPRVEDDLQNVTSPIGLNRTFVKKVNPVKLNFSNNAEMQNDSNDCVDHFADDFEASPPLSLDSDVL